MADMIDHYRLEQQLGQGGMGTVYLATDLNLQRPVAIKVMHPHLAARQEFQQRFLQEARAAARLDHPNIIKVLHFGAQENRLFLVTEYISGGSLRGYTDYLRAQGRLMNFGEAIELVGQIADALSYAHAQNMVHRDIKPDNVLLKPGSLSQANQPTSFQAVLTDFGLAKLSEGLVETMTGQTMGTLAYMSPEQCVGERVDARADIYSLGIMLYEVATGQLPYPAKTVTEAIRMHTTDPLPPPEAARHDILPELVDVIVKALEKNPGNRYQAAGDLSAALRSVGQMLPPMPPSLPESLPARPESIVTYLLSQPPVSQIPAFSAPPRGPGETGIDRIIYAGPAMNAQVYMIHKPFTSIGRESSADLVLKGEKVSRQHARLERSAEGHYVLIDLNSTNGTYLDNERLQANRPYTFQPGQTVRIGDFWLKLELAGAFSEVGSKPPQAAATVQSPQIPQAGPPSSAVAPDIAAVLNPPNVSVFPGARFDAVLEIVNQGTSAERFTMQVTGLPTDWLSFSTEALQLMPGAKGNFPIRFHPPAVSASTAGQYPFQIVVKRQSGGQATLGGMLTVGGYSDLRADVQPRRLRRDGNAILAVYNLGNTPLNFVVRGADNDQILTYYTGQSVYSLAPGQQTTIPVQVSASRRPLIGGNQVIPFDIVVEPIQGQGSAGVVPRPQAVPAELLVNSVVPLWIIPLVLMLCLGVVIIGIPLAGSIGGNNATSVAAANFATQTALSSRTARVTITPSATVTGTATINFGATAGLQAQQTQQAFEATLRSAASSVANLQTATAIVNQQRTLVALQQAVTLTLQAATQQALLQATIAAQQTIIAQTMAVQATMAAQTAVAQATQLALIGQTQTSVAQTVIAQTAIAQGAIISTQTAAAIYATQTAAANQAATQTVGAIVGGTQTAIVQTAAADSATQAAALAATQTAEANNAQGTAIAVQTEAAIYATQTADAVNAQGTAVAVLTTQTADAINALNTAVAEQTATALAAPTATPTLEIIVPTPESNTRTFQHVAGPESISGNTTTLNNPALNDNSNLLLFATCRVSVDSPVFTEQPLGVLYASGRYLLFNQDTSIGMPAGAAFNVLAVDPGGEAFIHTANAGNTSVHVTQLDHPSLNGNPNAIIFVAQNWNPPGSGGVYNPHEVGAWYDGSRWSIYNEDRAPLPEGASFNVLIRSADDRTFVHTASGGNLAGSATYLDHPALNGNPNALFMVTKNFGAFGIYSVSPIAVRYDPARNQWAIVNQPVGGTEAVIPEGQTFNVYVYQ